MNVRHLSDEELQRIVENARPSDDLSSLSEDELRAIAGVDSGTAFARGVGDGVSLSWGDEIMGLGAGAGALLQGQDPRAAFDRQASQSRENLRAAQRSQPLATGAGQVTGAIGSTLIPGGAIGQGVRGASLAGRVALAAGSGALIGGIQGAGQGETASDRLQGAAMGAAAGGALGGAGHAILGEAIPSVARLGRRYISGVTGMPTVPGRMGIAEMARDDLMATARQNQNLAVRSQSDLFNAMDNAARNDPTLTTAEVLGQSGQGRLAALARAPGQTGQRVEDFFVNRARNQTDEVTNVLTGRAPSSGDNLEQQLIQDWETHGRELYEPALSRPWGQASETRFRQTIAPRLERGNERFSPALSEAWDRAGRLIQEDVSLGRLPADAAANTARRLHYTKMALDDMVRDPTSVPSGLRHVSNAQMSAIARQFAESLDNGSTPIIQGYREARSRLADIGAARRAVQSGRTAFNRQNFASPEALQRHVSGLSPGERPFFFAGVEDALTSMIATAGRDGRRNVASSLLSDATQIRLRALFGEEAEGVIRRLRDISAKFDFGQRVRPTQGSITSNVMAQITPGIAGAGIGAATNLRDDPIAGALAGGALGFGISAAGRRAFQATILRAMERASERQRDLLGRIYLTPVGEYRRAAGALVSRAEREAQRRVTRARIQQTRGAVSIGAGSAGVFHRRDDKAQ